jgi:cell division protein FtsB
MHEFQAKKKVRKVLYSKPVVAFMILILAFMAHATWSVYTKEQESAANAAQAARELDRMKEREATLHSEIARLSTDQGIEEEIRAKYSVSKPGEQVLVIVEEEKATTTEEIPQESWWTKFINFFK